MNCQRVYFWELGDGTVLSLTVHFLGNKFRFNCSLSWELQGTNFFVLTVPCLGNFRELISFFLTVPCLENFREQISSF